MRHSVGLVLAACTALAGLACGSPAPARSAAKTTAAAAPADAPRAPDGASAAPSVEGPPAPAPRCRVTVTNTNGCTPSDVEALIEPVRARIEHCRGSGGGKVRIRMHEASGKLAFDVERGSSLNPIEKQCVLDALATISDPERSSAWRGLDVRPTGFTSLITIEW